MERSYENELLKLFGGLADELNLSELMPNSAGQVALHSNEYHITTQISAVFQERRYVVQLEADIFSDNCLELTQLKFLLANLAKFSACGLVIDAQNKYVLRHQILLQTTDPIEQFIETLKTFIGNVLQLRGVLTSNSEDVAQWSSEHMWV
ncbi:hypothetical protein [Pseudovibrio sp. Tun.PSC04-5.I4]|uniref:hypothetical protein n=1 Tax=Pseudovibrio sp. Tun.PSC04-5.I4 TaxID=1798213 RepID=UPI00087E1563|nr:hypothetical protein [Pseudovibrio sp. Tun.PSC04-5.I4]SDQ33275.1 hypothetical protein SAMN04515695_0891 [Pseudovibrio sp. Tun.PSC04-5.I4]